MEEQAGRCLGSHLASPEQDIVMKLETTELSEEEWEIRLLGAQSGG